jgi:serine/threonine protein kinase
MGIGLNGKGWVFPPFSLSPSLPLLLSFSFSLLTDSGLEALHSAGLVYGDLKPSNVFVGGSAEAPQFKIGDYGTLREHGRKNL